MHDARSHFNAHVNRLYTMLTCCVFVHVIFVSCCRFGPSKAFLRSLSHHDVRPVHCFAACRVGVQIMDHGACGSGHVASKVAKAVVQYKPIGKDAFAQSLLERAAVGQEEPQEVRSEAAALLDQ